jgi:hypothetical protein
MSALILPFMDRVMQKTDPHSLSQQTGRRAEGQRGDGMEEDEGLDRELEAERDGSAGMSRADEGDTAARGLQRLRQEQDDALFRELTRDGLFPKNSNSYAAVAELWLQRIAQQQQPEQGEHSRPDERAEEEQREPERAEAEAAAGNAMDDSDDSSILVEEQQVAAAVGRPAGSKGRKSKVAKVNGRSNGANGHEAAGAAVHGKENGSSATARGAEEGAGSSKRRQTLPVQNGSLEEDVQPERRKKPSDKSTVAASAGKSRRRGVSG